MTAEDVKWTFDVVVSPTSETGAWKATLGAFESPEILDGRTIRFRKKGDSVRDRRDLLHCGLFPILPKHVLEIRNFNSASFVGLPVCGPYRLARVDEQVESEFVRNSVWWRFGTSMTKGLYNFDRLVADQVPYALLWNTDQHRILYWNKFGMPEQPLGACGGERLFSPTCGTMTTAPASSSLR